MDDSWLRSLGAARRAASSNTLPRGRAGSAESRHHTGRSDAGSPASQQEGPGRHARGRGGARAIRRRRRARRARRAQRRAQRQVIHDVRGRRIGRVDPPRRSAHESRRRDRSADLQRPPTTRGSRDLGSTWRCVAAACSPRRSSPSPSRLSACESTACATAQRGRPARPARSTCSRRPRYAPTTLSRHAGTLMAVLVSRSSSTRPAPRRCGRR